MQQNKIISRYGCRRLGKIPQNLHVFSRSKHALQTKQCTLCALHCRPELEKLHAGDSITITSR